MTYTTHIFVGAAIGSYMPNAWLAFIVGLIAHHLLDSIPHLDEGSYINIKAFQNRQLKPIIIVATEVILGTIGLIYIAGLNESVNWVNIFWGALGGTAADLADNVPFWNRYLEKLPVFKQWFWLHDKLHGRLKKSQWLVGLLSQGILVALSVLILIIKK